MFIFLLFWLYNVYYEPLLHVISIFFMISPTYNSDRVFLHKQWQTKIFQYPTNFGSIFMMPKPPGAHQLPAFVEFLAKQEISVMVSLLQFEEVHSFSLVNEHVECETNEIEFINFPIKDHDVPQFFMPFNHMIEKLVDLLEAGENIAIHCYAGIGRTGLVAASMLIKQGFQVDEALIELSKVRGIRVPETLPQITWLHRHAEQLVRSPQK